MPFFSQIPPNPFGAGKSSLNHDVLLRAVMFVAIVVLGWNSAAMADTLLLKSGEIIKGKISKQSETAVILENDEGKEIQVDFKDVEKISVDTLSQEEKLKEQVSELLKTRAPSPQEEMKLSQTRLSAKDIFNKLAPATVVIRSEIKGQATSQGSGFIIDPAGVIVTNYHVVNGAQSISVKTFNGKIYPVRGIIDCRPWRDFCLLLIDALDLPVVNLANDRPIGKGDEVFVVGAPLGLEYSITAGIFSGGRWKNGFRWLQFSAPVSSGNSGGPLINEYGEVIGIASQCFAEGQNLNLGIDIKDVKRLLNGRKLRLTMTEFSQKSDPFQVFYEMVKGQNISLARAQYVVKELPDLVEGWLFLAQLYGSQNDLVQSLSAAEQALKIDPNDQNVLGTIAASYFQKGNYATAQQWFDKAMALAPEDQEILVNRASLYERQGQFTKAEEILRQILSSAEMNSASIYSNLGYILMQQEKDTEALENFQYAVNLDPQFGQAHLNLMGLYYKKGNYHAAIDAAFKSWKTGAEPGEEWRSKLRPWEDEKNVIPRSTTILAKQPLLIDERLDERTLQMLYDSDDQMNSGNIALSQQTLKNALASCGSIEKRACYEIYYQILRSGANQIQEKFASMNDSAQIEETRVSINEFNRFLESKGGAIKAIELYKRFLPNESQAHYTMTQSYTFNVGYYLSGMVAVLVTQDQKDFKHAMERLDSLGDSEHLGLLKETAETKGWTWEAPKKSFFQWPR